MQLKTSVECARWLAFQACAFRGHDESLDSKNRGNFIELIKFTSIFNDKVASVVLENAPGNAKYTSPTIQREILHILANNMRNAIREEIIIYSQLAIWFKLTVALGSNQRWGGS